MGLAALIPVGGVQSTLLTAVNKKTRPLTGLLLCGE